MKHWDLAHGLSERFHVLLNSLFKVLFNFPSRYLFAIGLVPVFSLRRGLPPALGCILKQPDSGDAQGLGTGDRQGPDTRSGSRPDQEDSGRPGARQSASLTPQCTAPARAGASALGSSRFTVLSYSFTFTILSSASRSFISFKISFLG